MDGIRMSTDSLFMRADTPSFLICGFHSLPALGKEFFCFPGAWTGVQAKGWLDKWLPRKT